MSIFYRRTIQGFVDATAQFLRPSQIRRLVDRLNTPATALSAEWELVLLSVFRKRGIVEHEPVCPGKTHPDILFTWPDQHLSFLSDIAPVSNRGLRTLYPIEAFSTTLSQKLHEKRLSGNGFTWELRNEKRQVLGESSKLRLCPERQFETRIFNADFDVFIESILSGRNQPAEYVIDVPDLYIRLSYQPGKESMTGHHPAIEYASSIAQNRIFDELSEKASQLRRAQHTSPLGILLCDGESQLLYATKSWNSYSVQGIILQFLKDNSDVSFVVIFTVQPERSFHVGPCRVNTDTYINPQSELFVKRLVPLFDSLGEYFPSAKQTPINARLRLEEGEPESEFCYLGGMTMTTRSIRMSARTLLEVLAGKIPVEDFTRNYCADARSSINPSTHKTQRGR